METADFCSASWAHSKCLRLLQSLINFSEIHSHLLIGSVINLCDHHMHWRIDWTSHSQEEIPLAWLSRSHRKRTLLRASIKAPCSINTSAVSLLWLRAAMCSGVSPALNHEHMWKWLCSASLSCSACCEGCVEMVSGCLSTKHIQTWEWGTLHKRHITALEMVFQKKVSRWDEEWGA